MRVAESVCPRESNRERGALGISTAPAHSVNREPSAIALDTPYFDENFEEWCSKRVALSLSHYQQGDYEAALETSDAIYRVDAYRAENLLLLGSIHFQLRNFSESIFYSQQCIKVDSSCAEAFSNLGNSLKELGDLNGALQFYLRAIKLKPRFSDAYNNLAGVYVMLGRGREAIETYQMALVLNPSLVDAHSNLGNLYKAQCRMKEAKMCYLEAIRIKPDFAIAWSNLAGVFKAEGQLDAASAYYKEAIRLAPNFSDAHSNLGNVLKEQGYFAEATSCYNKAIELRPTFAIAYGNLASCLSDQGHLEEAAHTFRRALQLDPLYHDAYNNLGNTLRQKGKLGEATEQFARALRVKPDNPHAYNNLGNAMREKGLVKEAIHFYLAALRLMPKFAAAQSNLGSIMQEQGRIDQALAHYREAITIDPLFADAYINMGNAYKDLEKFQDAIRCFSTAIKIKPGNAYAYSNLASAYKDGDKMDEAIACYSKALALDPSFKDARANLIHCRLLVCDWSSHTEDVTEMQKLVEEQLDLEKSHFPMIQPFHALSLPCVSIHDAQRIAVRYAEIVANRARLSTRASAIANQCRRSVRGGNADKIFVGYIGSNFGDHPLGHLVRSIFGIHDRSTFYITCYTLSPVDKASANGKQIESEADLFRDLSSLSAPDAARIISGDGIEVLIDLNGYTRGGKQEIFVLQPAPIQVHLPLGYCGTMGAPYIQYLIADTSVISAEDREFYSEAGIIYMPHSFYVNDHRQFISGNAAAAAATATIDRMQYGIPQDKFVFCNFNQGYKIDPAIFEAWMNILRRVPNSVLWLLRFPPAIERYLRDTAASHEVVQDRLVFSDVENRTEHILRGGLADLFLDTSACNARTTACDCLWAGTPLLTLKGEKMSARIASSLLNAAGLPELITHSLEEYEAQAVKLATDSEVLFELRGRLESHKLSSPLFDTIRWVRNLEQGLRQAVERERGGLAPGDIQVVDAADSC